MADNPESFESVGKLQVGNGFTGDFPATTKFVLSGIFNGYAELDRVESSAIIDARGGGVILVNGERVRPVSESAPLALIIPFLIAISALSRWIPRAAPTTEAQTVPA